MSERVSTLCLLCLRVNLRLDHVWSHVPNLTQLRGAVRCGRIPSQAGPSIRHLSARYGKGVSVACLSTVLKGGSLAVLRHRSRDKPKGQAAGLEMSPVKPNH